MGERVYLDWNATAPLRPQARAAMGAALDLIGNPSSIHAEGRAARATVEAAREAVAGLVGAAPGNVTFTSGGTEANALALTPRLEWPGGKGCGRLLVSAVEHPSGLAGGSFPAAGIERIHVTDQGVVDTDRLRERLRALAGGRPLVSVMLANNETGVIQPIAEVAALVHDAGGLLHVDAVQAAGRIPINISSLQADLVSLSAHKLGGPKGVGALVSAHPGLHFPEPLLRGGGQERGRRAGTENVAAIAGFGAAVRESATAIARDRVHTGDLRKHLEAGLREVSSDHRFYGAGVERLHNTSLFSLPGVKAETALIALDLAGLAVSSGSACSSGKVTPSHVLVAMGVEPEPAAGAIRVSLGWTSTRSDVDRFLEAWRTLVSRLNKTSKKGQRGLAA